MRLVIRDFFCVFFLLVFTQLGLVFGQDLINNGRVLGIPECLTAADHKLEAGDKKEASRFLNQAATIHWERKEYANAIELFERSAQLNLEITNWQGLNGIYSNLGMIYADIGSYDKSVEYFQKVIEYKRKDKDRVSLISSLINLSVSLNAQKKHSQAAVYLEEALVLAQEMNDPVQMRSCYGMLSETYDKAGDNTNSVKYFNLYRTFHEMISRNKENAYVQSIEETKLRNELLSAENKNKEFELLLKNQQIQEDGKLLSDFSTKNKQLLEKATKQDLIIALRRREQEMMQIKNDQKAAEAESALQAANLFRNVVIAAFVALAAFAGLIYRHYRRNKRVNALLAKQYDSITTQQAQIIKQKNDLQLAFVEIQNKNDNITHSINYAKRIQNAVLTAPFNLNKLHEKAFILFKPRDIVSGDFYWFAPLPTGGFLVAAVDCTGHGVPGAFMSMIGHEMLTEIYTRGIYSPGKILDELGKGIDKALHQYEDDGSSNVRDGMDMAILSLDNSQQNLIYAGAKNPLFLIQNNELKEIKANKSSIGGHMVAGETHFVEHHIDIACTSAAYIFSDGYKDQFGGANNKRFSTKAFKELLLEIHIFSELDQMKILDEKFMAWQGTRNQIDDVLVVGLTLTPAQA
ncbi:MAG: hypothetical protein EAZ57_03855 [Cytophagales bacterium]|nr:MAG: hypothetical protein EAZ67_04870 [Cytophagales bacterium]TAF61346.1 MAG: hypothetical protein EAZ57_03855 [Cytophagales bacterium]